MEAVPNPPKAGAALVAAGVPNPPKVGATAVLGAAVAAVPNPPKPAAGTEAVLVVAAEPNPPNAGAAALNETFINTLYRRWRVRIKSMLRIYSHTESYGLLLLAGTLTVVAKL